MFSDKQNLPQPRKQNILSIIFYFTLCETRSLEHYTAFQRHLLTHSEIATERMNTRNLWLPFLLATHFSLVGTRIFSWPTFKKFNLQENHMKWAVFSSSTAVLYFKLRLIGNTWLLDTEARGSFV